MKLPRAHHLPAEELAGQVLMPAVYISSLNQNSRTAKNLLNMVRQYHVGGIILFGGHPTDVQHWVNQLQQTARYPLLVASDLERGAGGMFSGGTIFPHALAWGAAGDLALVEDAARVIAREAKVLGINTIFSPVLDLANQPENPIINIRGFHSDPEKVSEIGTRFIGVMEKEGIACVAKHFPGHGRTHSDSHLDLPQISNSFAELLDSDLLPFRKAVEHGIRGVMTGHLKLADDPRPATFRDDLLNGYLRGKLNFQGLIYSDSLEMGAIVNNYSVMQQITDGIHAGLDIFLMPRNLPLFHSLIQKSAENDPAVRQILEKSVDRIFRQKKWLHRQTPQKSHPGRLYKFLEHPGHISVSRHIAKKSVTCLHRSERFPLTLPGIKNCLHIIYTDFETASVPLQNFQKELAAFFANVKTLQNPKAADIGNITQGDADLILFSLYSRTFGGHRSQFQWARINKIFSRLTESGLPVVALIFGNPFFISKLNNWKRSDALFLLYSYVESSQLAAFGALTSFNPVNGKLPVKINAGRSRISASSLPEKSYTLNFDTNKNRELPEAEEAIAKAIVQRIFPGGVLLIAHRGEVVHWKGYGKYDYDKPDGLQAQRVFPETNYDLASLTKVLATTPAILRLNDLGQIKLTDRLSDFYPALGHDWTGSVSIADLLAHQSGFPAWKPFYENVSGTEAVIQSVLKTQPECDPGMRAVYSDLGFILLGDIITRVTGEPLDIYCRNSVFQPLGLHSLHYIPAKADDTGIIKQKTFCPPTGFEKFRNRLIQGEVNDANCFAMGGVAGHAGLFGNALDAAAMGQMFLNRGVYNRRRFLNFSTARQAVQPFKPDISRRALGWDMPDAESSAGKYFSPQSYGHLAFTGPSMWIDPEKDLIIVFLCNRTHPDPNNNRIREFRPLLHDTVILSLRRMGLLN